MFRNKGPITKSVIHHNFPQRLIRPHALVGQHVGEAVLEVSHRAQLRKAIQPRWNHAEVGIDVLVAVARTQEVQGASPQAVQTHKASEHP